MHAPCLPATRRRSLLLALVALIVAGGLPARAVEPLDSPVTAASKAVGYVVGTQAPDGGFFGPDQPVAYSGGLADSIVAVEAADGRADRDALATALQRLAAHGPSATTRPAYSGRIVMAIVAAGHDPTDFGGHDYVAELEASYQPTGAYETQMFANVLAGLGVVAAGRPLPAGALLFVRANQCPDGGFGWATFCLGGGDVDTTALVVNLLVAADVPPDDVTLSRARDFLLAARNAAGGFGGRAGDETNANSTGLALSALAALGEHPCLAPWAVAPGVDPLTALLDLQAPEGGFHWMAGTASRIDNYATVQALPGLAGLAYPLSAQDEPVEDDPCRPLPKQGKGRGHGKERPDTPRGRR